MSLTRRSFVKKSSYSVAAVTILGAGVALASGGYSGKLAKATPNLGSTATLSLSLGFDTYTLYGNFSADPAPSGVGQSVTAYLTALYKKNSGIGTTVGTTYLDGSFDESGNFSTEVSPNISGYTLLESFDSASERISYFAAYKFDADTTNGNSRTLSGLLKFVKVRYIWTDIDPGPGVENGYLFQEEVVLSSDEIAITVEEVS